MANPQKVLADLSEQQGWSTHSQLHLVLQFVAENNLVDKFKDYLQQQAQAENKMYETHKGEEF